jgi:hypothetical protein
MAAQESALDKFGVFIPIGALSLIVIIPLLLVAIAGTASLGGPGGSSAIQPINVAPTSPLAALTNNFKQISDPTGYAKLNAKQLSDLSGKIQALDASIPLTGEYKGIPAEKVTQLHAALKAIVSDLASIQTKVGSSATLSANDTAAARTDFVKNWSLADRLFLSTNATGEGVARTAVQIVEYNKDGAGPITYSSDLKKRLSVINSEGYPTYQDCSGFISFTLQKSGVFKAGESASTAGFYDLIQKKDPRFTVVEQAIGSVVDSAKLKDASLGGVLQSGDIILTSQSSLTATGAINHAVLYLGANPTDSNGSALANGFNIAESTSNEVPLVSGTGTKNGPQFTTLAERLSHTNSKVQLILRVVAP